MNSLVSKNWNQLIENGETTIELNTLENMHLKFLDRIMGYIYKNKIRKDSNKGKVAWSLLDIMQKSTRLLCPLAYDTFWLYAENKKTLEKITNAKVSLFKTAYTFKRKKHLKSSDLRVPARSYAKVNRLRGHM